MSDDNNLTSDEVKEKVIEEYGFNAETQADQIEKLTAERLEHQKNLSKAIEQKAKYREQAQAGSTTTENTVQNESKPDGKPINNNQNVDRGIVEEMYLIQEGFSKNDIDTLKVVARGNGITLDEAKKHPMFEKFKGLQTQEETRTRAQLGASNASVSVDTSGKTKAQLRQDKHSAIMAKLAKQ